MLPAGGAAVLNVSGNRYHRAVPAPATARLIAAPAALAGCVRAFVVRDTTGLPPLPEGQRQNRFPASPLCSLSWIVEGETVLEDGTPMPRVALGGPRSQPRVSSNPGPVHVFIALFFPQALHALAGLDLSRHVDRFVPLDHVLDDGWQAFAREVLRAADDAARVTLVEDFVLPRWLAVRASQREAPGDWVAGLEAGVAAAGRGKSARSIERRIKVSAGQPLRRIRRLSRAERQFVDSHAAILAGSVAWADAAHAAGYADQAHLSRETRAVTGISPTELARRIREDESYWLYRIWSGEAELSERE